MKWNPEQEIAINTLGTNVTVSASAGAGKTAVLVERLAKRCLKDQVSINNIVAMTFTEAAAAEMKKRLLIRFNDELKKDLSSQEKAYIEQQCSFLKNARICTLDSFCLDLVKKYSYVLDLDPACTENILEETQKKQLQRQAFEETFLAQINEPEFRRCAAFFCPRIENFDPLMNATFKVIQEANSSFDPKGWMEKAKSVYRQTLNAQRFSDLEPTLLNALVQMYATKAELIVENADACVRFAMEHEFNEKVVQPLQLRRDYLSEAVKVIQGIHETQTDGRPDYDRYLHYLNQAQQVKFRAPAKVDEEFKTANDRTKKQLKDYLEECTLDSATLLHDLWDLAPMVETLLQFAEAVSARFAKLKQERACMDFEDMEHFAYELLSKDEGRVAQLVRQTVEELLVDEFQDTNDLQNEIVNLISNGHNVFRVGDVKQSIYRFRKAKPSIMRSYIQSSDPMMKNITLSYNYRSKEMIVEFNNLLFDKLMNVQGLQDTYTEKDKVQVGLSQQKENGAPVEFILLKANPKEENSKMLKARFIANKIEEMRATTPFKNYRDYVILVRSHAEKKELTAVFEKAGIPHFFNSQEGFSNSYVMQVLLSYCRLLLDKTDEISLVAVLTSPYYRYRDDDLAKLRLQADQAKISLWQVLVEQGHPIIVDVAALRMTYRQKGLVETFRCLGSLHDFYLEKLDSRQRSNFDYCLENVVRFSERSQSLSLWIEEIEQTEEDKSSEATGIGKEADVVRAVTFHQSKGLQYPVVFVWSTGKAADQEKREAVVVDTDFGVGLHHISLPYRFRRKSCIRQLIEFKNELEDVEEIVRLLYVALTRAQDRMILVDTYKVEPKQQTVDLALFLQRKGSTGLILSAVQNHPLFRLHFLTQVEDLVQVQSSANIVNQQVVLPHYTKASPQPMSWVTPSTMDAESYESQSEKMSLNFSNARAHGTLIHQAIERLKPRVWSQEDVRDYSQFDQRLLLSLNQHPLFRQTFSMQVEQEYPFYYASGQQVISGTIDYLAINEKEAWIIDFKTNRIRQLEELIPLYRGQMSQYREVVQAAYPNKKVRTFLYSTNLVDFIEIE